MEPSRLSDSSDSDDEPSNYVGFNQSFDKRKHDEESDELEYESKRIRFNDNSSNFRESIESEEDVSNDEDKKSSNISIDMIKNIDYQQKNLSNNEEKKSSNVVMDMMKKMGYQHGKGLGKKQQGIIAPVEASNQKGRRGLGHDGTKLSQARLKWDPAAEIVKIEEEITWLSNFQEPPTKYEMKDWLVLGPKKKTIDNETMYCDASIFEQVNSSKSIFDSLDRHEMRRARTRSNPYETIRGHFFLNRAAVKMANMDKVCEFMFTRPLNLGNELLYFADVCAGPGGFSEYILHRKNWHAKGFGFTLKAENDFKLEDFWAGPPETFHPFYGPHEDGNVYDPENQDAFRHLIMEHTNGLGVHFMMADGGFSVEGDENMQEILSKQLYLCQCLVALMIVRDGGHFVTKLFDIFTDFSAGLVYIMSRCFQRISIFKPNTSRPANSERYLICQGKLPNIDDAIQYLSRANHLISKNDDKRDVTELVPFDIIKNDQNFFDYLYETNTTLGSQQVVGLLKIAAFCEDMSLNEPRQPQIRRECLKYWELEDMARKAPRNCSPDEKLREICQGYSRNFMKSQGKILSLNNIKDTVLNTPYEWYCVPCSGGKKTDADKLPTFYLGMGRGKVFRLVKNTWERIPNIELPGGTLIYGEILMEFKGEYKVQLKLNTLHIIDAYSLGSENISSKPLLERYGLIKKFCDALWKPTYGELYRVRAKDLHSIHDGEIKSKLNLKTCVLKNGTKVLGHFPHESLIHSHYYNEENFFYLPNSVIFLKNTAFPWKKFMSRSTKHIYYYNLSTKVTEYENKRPVEACASFPETFDCRLIWNFPNDEELTIDVIHDQIETYRRLNENKS